jgi:hypothetical protein
VKGEEYTTTKIIKGIRLISVRRLKLLLLVLVFLLSSCCHCPCEQVVTQPLQDQQNSAAVTQIYFYPIKGQSIEQQSRDHYACYNWAVKQTGFDPSVSSIVPEQRVRVVPMPPPGHDTVIMSIAGAVLGALIGGYHHSGEGALIGAASGAVVGAASDVYRAEAAKQIEEAYRNRDQARDLRKEKIALKFRRAMSACMEGHGYIVK